MTIEIVFEDVPVGVVENVGEVGEYGSCIQIDAEVECVRLVVEARRAICGGRIALHYSPLSKLER
jgi:hypothetical protein